ncbi:MAG: hypothetical protein Edafosvirus7_30 [Edafosvirus sp.]|uniref:Uncharacterized protein n=1 Tax=Edafosvirus sp. TaxID=2487765 RepID=A0A3G4ZTL9_9VIRU|nr:MAG: hypothetical protein Edafosvirus7_30 [Edafosvirus sp.]
MSKFKNYLVYGISGLVVGGTIYKYIQGINRYKNHYKKKVNSLAVFDDIKKNPIKDKEYDTIYSVLSNLKHKKEIEYKRNMICYYPENYDKEHEDIASTFVKIILEKYKLPEMLYDDYDGSWLNYSDLNQKIILNNKMNDLPDLIQEVVTDLEIKNLTITFERCYGLSYHQQTYPGYKILLSINK